MEWGEPRQSATQTDDAALSRPGRVWRSSNFARIYLDNDWTNEGTIVYDTMQERWTSVITAREHQFKA